MRFTTFNAMLDCKRCGGHMPLPGPVREVQCSSCLATSALTEAALVRYVKAASEHYTMILGEVKMSYADAQPCSACDQPIALDTFAIGTEGAIACTKCAAEIRSAPPPPWLAAQLPNLIQLYGAVRDAADEATTAPAAVVPAKPVGPIVTRCPECNGSLKVTTDSARTVVCEHCSTNVFLPDELWRTLHPMKRAAFWTLAFEPPLRTPQELLEERQEKERKQAERDREREQEKQRQAIIAHDEVREAKRSRLAVWISVLLLATAAAIGLLARS